MTRASKGETDSTDCILDGSRFGFDILGTFDSGEIDLPLSLVSETRGGELFPLVCGHFKMVLGVNN
jgi:hypothetical protein